MKHPVFDYKIREPKKVFNNEYTTIEIQTKTLGDLIRSLPKNISFDKVSFDVEVSIDHGYYNEASAVVDRLFACFYADGENENYEKEKQIYDIAKAKYDAEMAVYNEWFRKEEIKRAEEILRKYGKK